MIRGYSLAAAAMIAVVAACSDDTRVLSVHTYRLYRTSVTDASLRMHVATFDSKERGAEGTDYNWGNCEIARDLFQEQSGVRVRYWCEPTPRP